MLFYISVNSIKTNIYYTTNKAIADKFTKYYSKLMEKAEDKLTPHEKNIVLYCRKQVDDYNELKDTIQPYLGTLHDMQVLYEKNPADWLTSYLARLDEELAQAKDDLMLADLSMDSAKSGALRIIEDMENGADDEELVDLMEEANEILEAHRTAQRNISKANGRIQILTEIKEEAAESVKKKASSPTIKIRTPYDPVINVGKHVNWIKPGVLKNTAFDAVLAEILK